MCKTRIEKNAGCNHMTCGYCNYEFCWACGASATSKDDHFGATGTGCGIGMMEEGVKPGQQPRQKPNKCCSIFKIVLKVIVLIILWPLIIVFYAPIACAIGAFKGAKDADQGIIWEIIAGIAGFIAGLILNICVIPLMLIYTLCLIVVIICKIFQFILGGCKCTTSAEELAEAEAENRRRAEQVIAQKQKSGKEGNRV